jgi:hypothetical protein
MKLDAIKQDDLSIEYIIDSTEQMKIEAVRKNGRSLKYIKEPSEKIILEAINQNCFVIEYIKDPSEKIKLESVRQNGFSIKFIEKPCLQVQLEDVKQNINSIFYIEKPKKEVVFYCITVDPELLKVKKTQVDYQKLPENYFQNLSLKIQKMLVEYNVIFTMLINNLHQSLKNKLTNIRKVGLF